LMNKVKYLNRQPLISHHKIVNSGHLNNSTVLKKQTYSKR